MTANVTPPEFCNWTGGELDDEAKGTALRKRRYAGDGGNLPVAPGAPRICRSELNCS